MDLNNIWDFLTQKIATKKDLIGLEERFGNRLDTLETRVIRIEVEVKGIAERLALKEIIDKQQKDIDMLKEKVK